MNRVPILLLMSVLGVIDASAQSDPDDCLDEPTLEDLVDCVKDFMPGNASEDYDTTVSAFLADWQTAVTALMGGACEGLALPASIDTIYTVSPFMDDDNGKTYCVLLETRDFDNDNRVDRGWGTFIYDPNATRNLSFDVPHPKFDTNTPDEAIFVYKAVEARTYVLAGADRRSNAALSPCQDEYQVADVAHNTNSLFHASVAALDDFYDDQGATYTAIQYHAIANDTCPGVDVYITHGRNQAPQITDPIVHLRDAFVNAVPDAWNVSVMVPGDLIFCNRHGSENVQGRLLNDAPGNVCTTAAPTYDRSFIHIEQKRFIREDSVYGYWATAILETDQLPVELERFEARLEGDDVLLQWRALHESGTGFYEVQAEASGGYRPLAQLPAEGTQDGARTYHHRLSDVAPGVHRFRLRMVDGDGSASYSPEVTVEVGLDDVFTFSAAYPNPFAGTARFELGVGRTQHVRVAAYDVAGREVAVLMDEEVAAGPQRVVTLPAGTLAAGLYFVRATGEQFRTERTVLLRR